MNSETQLFDGYYYFSECLFSLGIRTLLWDLLLRALEILFSGPITDLFLPLSLSYLEVWLLLTSFRGTWSVLLDFWCFGFQWFLWKIFFSNHFTQDCLILVGFLFLFSGKLLLLFFYLEGFWFLCISLCVYPIVRFLVRSIRICHPCHPFIP